MSRDIREKIKQKAKTPDKLVLSDFFEECKRMDCDAFRVDLEGNRITCKHFLAGVCLKTSKEKFVALSDVLKILAVHREKLRELLLDVPTCVDCEYCVGDMEGNSHCSLDSTELCDGMICPIQRWAFETKKKFGLLFPEKKET